MNLTLLFFVLAYLIATLALGVWVGRRIRTTSDFALAGRNLPLYMIITTTFATWFGAETVMGAPSTFLQGGLHAVVEEPFGSGICLILVGAFFAARLYRMNLLTIGDYYRQRYGKGVEVFCSVAIILSYLGWVGAQITALGLVFSVLSGGAISEVTGMVVGTIAVLVYVVVGGFLAVAWTDFIQMLVLVAGLLAIAFFAADLAGGAGVVIDAARSRNLFQFLPPPNFRDIAAFVAAGLTMMLGSIPQQDVFQRVMSAKDAKTAQNGAIIGGSAYLVFAFVPMFIVTAAMVVMGDQVLEMAANDYQKILPAFIMGHMPLAMQILFFGALLSAIKSTSSATLLAPSTSFVENILRNLYPSMSDKQSLTAMRVTILVFTFAVLVYAIAMRGTSVYELVASAYQVTLVCAFVPLVMGLFWKRATTQGAALSILLGVGTWVVFFPEVSNWGEWIPGQLAGLAMALVGMIVGSLVVQWIPAQSAHTHQLAPKTGETA
ncbi:MAG: sodium:solute symporter family protein, partial [Burkholderiaceae bacterium]|nr:sodium:solute symporter family protein [Burkholderiaceae bacterium]